MSKMNTANHLPNIFIHMQLNYHEAVLMHSQFYPPPNCGLPTLLLIIHVKVPWVKVTALSVFPCPTPFGVQPIQESKQTMEETLSPAFYILWVINYLEICIPFSQTPQMQRCALARSCLHTR